MDSIKIAISAKKRFAELFEMRIYRKHPSHQFFVKHYKTGNQKIAIDEEK
jgi:hypothetical protein